MPSDIVNLAAKLVTKLSPSKRKILHLLLSLKGGHAALVTVLESPDIDVATANCFISKITPVVNRYMDHYEKGNGESAK